MLVGRVVDDELGDDADAARMRRRDEALDVGHRAVVGMHRAVFADVVAVVEPRRGIERQQPDRVDAKLDDVVELHHQPGEVADAVIVGVEERLDVHLVDDRVLVPERIVRRGDRDAWLRGVHGAPPGGATRQIANGRSAGSRRTCCSLPVQTARVAAHQILDIERAVIGKLPLPQRQLERRGLHVVRIEADRDQDHVRRRRAGACRRAGSGR